MIDIEACRDRLASMDPAWTFTGDAVDAVDAMENMSAPVPAAYVMTASERASKSGNTTGRTTQTVEQTVSILFAVGAQRADAQLRDEVDVRKNALIDLFMGWTPPGAQSPFNYSSFSVRMMAQGIVWAELLFSARYVRSRDAT